MFGDGVVGRVTLNDSGDAAFASYLARLTCHSG
jgi:hypothetical protein